MLFSWASCACAPCTSATADSELLVPGPGEYNLATSAFEARKSPAPVVFKESVKEDYESCTGRATTAGSSSASEVPSNPECGESDTEDLPTPAVEVQRPNVRGQLCPSDLATVRALEEALGEQTLASLQSVLVPGEAMESMLLRFARVHGGRVRPTVKALQAHFTWHQRSRPDLLAELTPGGAAGCADELIEKYMPTLHQGFDRQRRPIVWTHYGKYRTKPFHDAGVGSEQLLQLQVRNSERTARLCGLQSSRYGCDISSALIVIDAEGLDSQVATSRLAFELARGFTKLDQEHFPDRMGQCLILNAPPAVQYFFRATSWIFPERERQRVRILGGREEWMPVLLDLADPENLPVEYGGVQRSVTTPDSVEEV